MLTNSITFITNEVEVQRFNFFKLWIFRHISCFYCILFHKFIQWNRKQQEKYSLFLNDTCTIYLKKYKEFKSMWAYFFIYNFFLLIICTFQLPIQSWRVSYLPFSAHKDSQKDELALLSYHSPQWIFSKQQTWGKLTDFIFLSKL